MESSTSISTVPPSPGSTWLWRTSPPRNREATASSWRTWPKVNARRNDPNVEGAYGRSNNRAIAPCRSRARSSIESAPAIIPATSALTFPPALDPLSGGTLSRSPASASSPASAASRITGTSPAADTRFGSSKLAAPTGLVSESRICEMPFVCGRFGPSASPILLPRKGISALRHAYHAKIIGGSRLSGRTFRRRYVRVVVDRTSDARYGRRALDGPRCGGLVPRDLGHDDGRDDVPLGRSDCRPVLAHDQAAVSAVAAAVCGGLSAHVDRRGSRRLHAGRRHQPARGWRTVVGPRREVGRGHHARRRGGLRADTAQGRLPWQVRQPARLPPWILARRPMGRPADGYEERRLVRRLLLGADGVAVRTWRHECDVDGLRRGVDRPREDSALASRRDLRDNGSAAHSWRAAVHRAPSYPDSHCSRHHRPDERHGADTKFDAVEHVQRSCLRFARACSRPRGARATRHFLDDLYQVAHHIACGGFVSGDGDGVALAGEPGSRAAECAFL